jgi:hypothetical protein
LDVTVEVIATPARANRVLASLRPEIHGFDVETAPLAGRNGSGGWIRITAAGRPAKNQPRPADKDGLDPLRARPRLAQLYDTTFATVYIFDLAAIPEACQMLARHRLVSHNPHLNAPCWPPRASGWTGSPAPN